LSWTRRSTKWLMTSSRRKADIPKHGSVLRDIVCVPLTFPVSSGVAVVGFVQGRLEYQRTSNVYRVALSLYKPFGAITFLVYARLDRVVGSKQRRDVGFIRSDVGLDRIRSC